MRRRFFVMVTCLCLLTSCQRVRQYPAVVPPEAVKAEPKEPEDEGLYRLSWIEPRERRDLPIVLVPSDRPEEWDRLPAYWNLFPLPTLHVGLPPVEALSAIVLTDHHHVIKIKVPLGLPDPTPHIPPTNPPSFGQWQLGKRLFFDRQLKVGDDNFSCASCHEPRQGFADGSRHPVGGRYNTLSLINVVYNRRQFWDGRVATLEETLFRGPDDERKVDANQAKDKAVNSHVWTGFVRALVQYKEYDHDFDLVFGVPHPTQDTVARALATYMRTILAGDSVYDRADAVRRAQKAASLSVDHFRAVLKDQKSADDLRDEEMKDRKVEDLPALLAKGYTLFHGKARCAKCHTGTLFTDQDYHNVGYEGEEGQPPIGAETGRAAHVPIGHKEARLIGAFRTPTLRNLVKTAPYFHNGSLPFLRQVVQFYDQDIVTTQYLARELTDNNRELRLHLTADEPDALVLFLRSLEGRSVDPQVTVPPSK